MDWYSKMLTDYIATYLNEVSLICNEIDHDSILKFANTIKSASEEGGRLFFAGVGGSAANTSHAVNDFRKLLNVESYCISDNISELTARINDEGWTTSYREYLRVSKFCHRDVLIVFSVGGGSDLVSANLVEAVKYANSKNADVLSIASRDGGYCGKYSTVCVHIPVVSEKRVTPHAEEWQGIIWHLVVSMLKERKS